MPYPAAAILALASQCAPNVAPQTVAAIVATESRGEHLALNVNGGPPVAAPATVAKAIATARQYVAAGYSVDLGLGQINSRNMRRLGLSWEMVFDPCANIAALGQIITGNYHAALGGREPQHALRVALSLYNTGSPTRGFRNGYVGRVVRNAGVTETPEPAFALIATGAPILQSPVGAENSAQPMTARVPPRAPPAWNLFERAAYLQQAALASDTSRRISVWAR